MSLELLLGCVPVHRRARITRWGLVEGLAFLELPAFLVLTGVRRRVILDAGHFVKQEHSRRVGRLLPRLR